MNEINVSSVNAEPEVNVEPQIDNTVTESVNGEVATPQKPVQSAEDNAKYAAIRREAEQKASAKALDDFIAKEGYTYNGKPITSYAEYQKIKADIAAEEQKQQFKDKNGFDPDEVKPLFEQWKESDPDFQELKQLRTKTRVETAVQEFAKEFPDLGVKSIEDVAKLPNFENIIDYVEKRGLSLNEAYKLANYNETVNKTAQAAQQEVLKKIAANGESSPGSLSNTAEEEKPLTEEDIEKMSPAEMTKRWKDIKKALKMR